MIGFGDRSCETPSRHRTRRARMAGATARHELEVFYEATHSACWYAMRLRSPRMIPKLCRRGELCGAGTRKSVFPRASAPWWQVHRRPPMPVIFGVNSSAPQ